MACTMSGVSSRTPLICGLELPRSVVPGLAVYQTLALRLFLVSANRYINAPKIGLLIAVKICIKKTKGGGLSSLPHWTQKNEDDGWIDDDDDDCNVG